MAVSVVSFSFFMAAQPDPGVNSSVCWLSLLNRVYFRLPLYCLPSFSPISHCSQFVGLILPSNSHAVIQTRLNACATSSDFQRPGYVTSFRCTTLNGIFGRVKRSRHNTCFLLAADEVLHRLSKSQDSWQTVSAISKPPLLKIPY